MKTPIEELLAKITEKASKRAKELLSIDFNSESHIKVHSEVETLLFIAKELHESLPKEREVIIKAFKDGYIDCSKSNHYSYISPYNSKEHYFKIKFN